MARHPSSLMYTIQLNLSCLLLTTQRPAKMNYGEVMRIMAQLSLRLFSVILGNIRARGIEIRTKPLGGVQRVATSRQGLGFPTINGPRALVSAGVKCVFQMARLLLGGDGSRGIY